jgi:ArsR family transcriptional regulator
MDTVETFRALADPIRLRMVQMLLQDHEVYCTTFDDTFAVGKSTISYHVKALRSAGLITVRKEGRYYAYTLRRAIIEHELPGLLAALRSLPQTPVGPESSEYSSSISSPSSRPPPPLPSGPGRPVLPLLETGPE